MQRLGCKNVTLDREKGINVKEKGKFLSLKKAGVIKHRDLERGSMCMRGGVVTQNQAQKTDTLHRDLELEWYSK